MKKKLLYISCHAILEYQEVLLFSELGYEVFSTGVYAYPYYREGIPRPGIPTLTHFPEMERLASTIDANGGDIPQQLIDWADIIVFMHRPEWLEKNWEKIKQKKVVFRSIGQSLPHIEELLKKLRSQGLQIVRYSPVEHQLPHFAGEDALIRFYEDPEEFYGYTGEKEQAINITQSLRQRRRFCHYDEITQALQGFPHKIYGHGNEDLGESYGGRLSFEEMKRTLRENRVFVYAGTWPAAYTLSLLEAMFTGIPIVSIGIDMAEKIQGVEKVSFFEVPMLFKHERHMLIAENVPEMRNYIDALLKNPDMARSIGEAGRAKAIEIFGKKTISDQWKIFLEKIL